MLFQNRWLKTRITGLCRSQSVSQNSGHILVLTTWGHYRVRPVEWSLAKVFLKIQNLCKAKPDKAKVGSSSSKKYIHNFLWAKLAQFWKCYVGLWELDVTRPCVDMCSTKFSVHYPEELRAHPWPPVNVPSWWFSYQWCHRRLCRQKREVMLL